MKKSIVVIVSLFIFIKGIAIWKNFINKPQLEKSVTLKKTDSAIYWTCPMHPQINQDHPGECPICHMNLVKISKKSEPQIEQTSLADERSSVEVSPSQFALSGTQKYSVEKMDIKITIPISGRAISGNQLAFQTYESDLRYMRPGLNFSGRADIFPEEEITGIISSVDPIVDPTSRTVRVIGSINKGPKILRAESSFRGEILIHLQDRVAIPENSVLHTGKGDLVYLFDKENRLHPTLIILGQKSEGFYEILKGLSPGDVISLGPNFLIDSEAKIRGAND